MSATSATETMPLSDEAILGIESESSRGADGNDSRSDADAIDAEFASRETAPGAENRAHEERDATGREARREESDAAGRDSREENRAARRDGKDGDRSARQQRDDASEQKATPQRDANAERTLPLTSLAEFDAGFYSGDAASRTALAQSLFSSDPAAFRAMFDEAARLLGVTASRGENIANAANGNGAVAEASATADRFRPPAVPAQNQDGGLPTRSGQLPASATQTDHGMRDENAATNDARNNASRNDASQNAARGDAAPNSARVDALNSPAAPPAAFPAESYRAFESATNEAVAREVRGAITRTLEQVLPDGVAEGAARRIGEDIFGEVGKLLAADAQLSSQVGETLRGWRFGAAEQQQVASLLSGRARQILPSVARRVIGEWTTSVLSAARTRATRSDSAARRVDVGGAASGDGAARGAARALRPREIDYARTSDDDIFSM
jgi:hypothetical protein